MVNTDFVKVIPFWKWICDWTWRFRCNQPLPLKMVIQLSIKNGYWVKRSPFSLLVSWLRRLLESRVGWDKTQDDLWGDEWLLICKLSWFELRRGGNNLANVQWWNRYVSYKIALYLIENFLDKFDTFLEGSDSVMQLSNLINVVVEVILWIKGFHCRVWRKQYYVSGCTDKLEQGSKRIQEYRTFQEGL